jgi:ABC-type Fe3+/spermidine/putrescine transport system ATPase subunit
MVISDRIAVLQRGRAVQIGTADELFNHPRTRFVAEFIGRTNVIDAIAIEADTVMRDAVRLRVATGGFASGAHVALSLRPHQIEIGAPAGNRLPIGGVNVVTGIVRRRSFLGDRIDYEVEITKSDLVLRVAALPSPPLQPGDTVHLRIDPAACVPLAAD